MVSRFARCSVHYHDHLHLKWLQDMKDLGVVQNNALAHAIDRRLNQHIPLYVAQRAAAHTVAAVPIEEFGAFL